MIELYKPSLNNVIGSCGWRTFRRNSKADYEPLTEILGKNSARSARVFDYVSSVFENQDRSHFVDVDHKDARLIKLSHLMAGVALKEFGNDTSTVLDLKEAIKSDKCTDHVISNISRVGLYSVHLVTIDARKQITDQIERDRANAIFQSANENPYQLGYFAILDAVSHPNFADTNQAESITTKVLAA